MRGDHFDTKVGYRLHMLYTKQNQLGFLWLNHIQISLSHLTLTEPHQRKLQLYSATSNPKIDGEVLLMETVTWSNFHGP